MKPDDYNAITETPGLKASKEQIERLYQRYNFAREFSRNKDILEVACGSGLGLGCLAIDAKSVWGVDVDRKNIDLAADQYKGDNKIKVSLMDAHELSVPGRSVDLVLLFEAIYYLHKPAKFIALMERILRKNGVIIICTVNKDWKDFHPSPYTHKYFSVPELCVLLKEGFKDIKFYGGFPIVKEGIKDTLVSQLKRVALQFNLIPGSLKARAYLKRIFMGKLVPLPTQVYEGMASYEEPVEIPCDDVCKDYKIVYAVAKK